MRFDVLTAMSLKLQNAVYFGRYGTVLKRERQEIFSERWMLFTKIGDLLF